MKKFRFLSLIALFSISALTNTSCGRITYSITFNSNGGSEVPTQFVKKNKYAERPENPTKTAYDFVSWRNGSKVYDFEHTKVTENISLKAKWKATNYKIEYNYSFEGNTSSNPTSYTIEDEVYLYAPSYIVANYHFVGYKDQNGNVYNDLKISKGTYGNLVLTDVWEINVHNVTSNSSYNLTGLGAYAVGDNVTVKFEDEVPFGYYFRGFYVTEGNRTSEVVSYNNFTYSFTMPDNDVSIAPNFELIIACIIYDFDGGEAISSNPSTYVITMGTVTLINPTRAGYEFLNWTLNGEVITELTAEVIIPLYLQSGLITIKANWEVSYVNVSFKLPNGNYGLTVTGSGDYLIGSQCTITATVSNKYYYFAGWKIGDDFIELEKNYTFTVPQNNLVIEPVVNSVSELYLYYQNNNGKNVKSLVYWGGSDPFFDSTSEYDEFGRVLSTIDIYESGEIYTYSYTYDDVNHTVSQESYSSLDSIYYNTKWLDDHNNVTKEEYYWSNDNEIRTNTFTYTYDDKGRVSTISGSTHSGSLEYTFEKKCEYVEINGKLKSYSERTTYEGWHCALEILIKNYDDTTGNIVYFERDYFEDAYNYSKSFTSYYCDYIYNEKNQLQETKSYLRETRVLTDREYFEYDDSGFLRYSICLSGLQNEYPYSIHAFYYHDSELPD